MTDILQKDVFFVYIRNCTFKQKMKQSYRISPNIILLLWLSVESSQVLDYRIECLNVCAPVVCVCVCVCVCA